MWLVEPAAGGGLNDDLVRLDAGWIRGVRPGEAQLGEVVETNRLLMLIPPILPTKLGTLVGVGY